MLRPEGDTLFLSGEVTNAHFEALSAAAVNHVGRRSLVVDWSAVERVDSSAVALIVAWQRDAARGQAALVNAHLPHALVALIGLYGLADIVATDTPT